MEFLLQLMAELFNIETDQPDRVAVAETVNNEIINMELLNSNPFDLIQSEENMALEEGLIFNYVHFN